MFILDWLRSRNGPDIQIGFLCECSDPACSDTVVLSGQQLEGACSDADWFALAAGHEPRGR